MGAEAGSDEGEVPQKNTRVGEESGHHEAKSLTGTLPASIVRTKASVVKIPCPGWAFGSGVAEVVLSDLHHEKYLLEDLSPSSPGEAEIGGGLGIGILIRLPGTSDGLMF